MNKQPVRIIVPPGIGDTHWALMKVLSLMSILDRPVHVYVGSDVAHSTVNYLRLVKFVDAAFEDNRNANNIENRLNPHYKHPKWSSLDGCRGWNGFDFILYPNGHLENGHRIETFLPELTTQYTYELGISNESRERVRLLAGENPFLLYLSGVGPNLGFHNWWWKPEHWVTVIRMLNSKGIMPMIIGAKNFDDERYMDMVIKASRPSGMDFKNLIGQTSHEDVCALILSASVWVGLNSGTGIVSAMQGIPTMMMWSDSNFHLPGVAKVLHANMKSSWLSNEQLLDGHYATVSYGDPKTTPEAVVEKSMAIMR